VTLRINPEVVRQAAAREAEAFRDMSDYYAALLDNARTTRGLSEDTVFGIPIASFLARTARAALNHNDILPSLPAEIADRVEVGRGVMKTVAKQGVDAGLFTHYKHHNGFANVSFRTDKNPLRLSIYGESIIRDTGWVAGGVVRVVQERGGAQSSLQLLLASPNLQIVGWAHEKIMEAAHIRLGQPYIHPSYLSLEPVRRLGHGVRVEAMYIPEARNHIYFDPSAVGCPVRRVRNPAGDGTAFQAEWADMVSLLLSNNATAERPITQLEI
jgi:hypothetical protein